jgi:hypothetical protein
MSTAAIQLLGTAVADVFLGFLRIYPYALTIAASAVLV